jgi:hypothetical protein
MVAIARPDGGTTTVDIAGSGPGVLLAHGAGAGHEHPFMVGVRRRLVAAGFCVATFDYPYREEGRRAPDRFERLLACHQAVFDHVCAAADAAPFLVGKSMGGRIGSHLRVTAPGWVFLGYPLVAAGKTVPRDVSHLAVIGPLLFIQGSRDSLAPLPLITGVVAALAEADLEVIPDADHGFRVPKRTGIDAEVVMDRIADRMADWMRRVG